MKAMLLARSKEVRDDGSIVEVVIRERPAPLSPSVHSYKYRLFYGTPAEERVRYDNERGKGDHRHCGGKKEGYAFCHPRSTARRLRKRPTRLEHDMKSIIEVAHTIDWILAAYCLSSNGDLEKEDMYHGRQSESLYSTCD